MHIQLFIISVAFFTVVAIVALLSSAAVTVASNFTTNLNLLELDSHGKVCGRPNDTFKFNDNCDPREFPHMACDMSLKVDIFSQNAGNNRIEERIVRCPSDTNTCDLAAAMKPFHFDLHDNNNTFIKLVAQAFDSDAVVVARFGDNHTVDEVIGTFRKEFHVADLAKLCTSSDNITTKSKERVEFTELLVDRSCRHLPTLKIQYTVECIASNSSNAHNISSSDLYVPLNNNFTTNSTALISSSLNSTHEAGGINTDSVHSTTLSDWLITLAVAVLLLTLVFGGLIIAYRRYKIKKIVKIKSNSKQQQQTSSYYKKRMDPVSQQQVARFLPASSLDVDGVSKTADDDEAAVPMRFNATAAAARDDGGMVSFVKPQKQQHRRYSPQIVSPAATGMQSTPVNARDDEFAAVSPKLGKSLTNADE